ncbi:hypothetical protein [Okeania sp. SIO3I5]|uniref:hypothetical protein n=1 Tax=Okeania sp. SIO3I5 TaxID=2607805 RepID=UPI0025D608AA|nr:hypothetical protein [Okeania sp. SIO3I5]
MDAKKLVLGGIGLILGSAIVASAASIELSVEQEQVICKLKETVEAQEKAGKKLVFWPLIGKVKERVEVPFTAELSADVSYTIMAVCDDNCSNLNLNLENKQRNKILNDEKQDGIPVISFTPTENSDYRITARPDKCTTEKCEFGMALFVPKSVELDVASQLPEELYLFKFCQE